MTLRTLNCELRTHRWMAGGWSLIALVFCCSPASAEVPHLIRYQGQAVDEQQTPLEGPYDVTFRLYDAETGGTKLWEETQPNIPLAGGQFSVLLGQVTPLTVNWSQPCWLSVQVGDEQELAPRQRITSVPLAIQAEAAERANSAGTATIAERLSVPVTTSTMSDDANRLVPSGAIVLWVGTACPAGYSRFAALDGAMLKAGSNYAGPTAAGTADLPGDSGDRHANDPTSQGLG